MVLAESPSLQPRVQRFEVLAIQAIQAMRAELRDPVLPDVGAVTVEASRSSVHVRPTFLPPRFRERHAMPDLHHRLHFGAAYYAEYQPENRLERDLDLMAEAGFTVIRVGESVWSTWEPEDGRFDLDWLQPVLDGAHARGIAVILGTPTYAMPPWLRPQVPGDRGRTRDRASASPGAPARTPTTPTRRSASTPSGSSAQVVGRYADHPAVIGYQVDNEPGIELFHNRGAFQRFVDRLRRKYGDVEHAQRALGARLLVAPARRLGRAVAPDGNTLPPYDLAWRRFQAELTTEFIAWQAGIVRELAAARPVRHDLHGATTAAGDTIGC